MVVRLVAPLSLLVVKSVYKAWAWYTHGGNGRLSWQLLTLLSWRHIRYARSRSVVTIGAVAVGVSAMVILLSFGYGLQAIVTDELIQPYSLRLADVQTDSTALSLNREVAEQIARLAEVEDVAPLVSLAGLVGIDGSRAEAVVLGVENRYFEYDHTSLLAGDWFSEEADQRFMGLTGESQLEALREMGQVAGVMDQGDKDPVMGEVVNQDVVRFRVVDERYIPLRSEPRMSAPILGYVRGGGLEVHRGVAVWGSRYESVDVYGSVYQSSDGSWWGQWLAIETHLWEEVGTGVYRPIVREEGGQERMSGYVTNEGVRILSRAEEVVAEMTGEVLGEATESAALREDLAAFFDEEEEDDESALEQLVSEETGVVEEGAEGVALAQISVARDAPREMVVSTGLLRLWDLEPRQVLGQSLSSEFIVSGGLISGITGRVVSHPEDYLVVGVVEDDNRPLVYVPLGDVMSMEVERYTGLRVLSQDEASLERVRTRIESMGFMTFSMVDTLLQVERLFQVMRLLMILVGLVGLGVAVLGMFNTLTVSLLERTREVGIMKTLGTTNRDVMRIFIVESLLLGALGGVAGLMIGWVFGLGVNTFFWTIRGLMGVSLFVTPWYLTLIVLVMSTGVGLLTGLLPARRTRRISALDALRYE